MTVGQIKKLLENYPDNWEFLISLHAQDDIFVVCDGLISGKFNIFPEELFESAVGEIQNKHPRNCVGVVRKKIKK